MTAIYDVVTSVFLNWILGIRWWVSILSLYLPFLSGSPAPYPFGLVHELTTAVLMFAIGPTLTSRVKLLVNQTTKVYTERPATA